MVEQNWVVAGKTLTVVRTGRPAAELKTMQEVITLVMFAGFSVWVLGEPLTWKHAIGFTLIAIGAAVIFYK